MTVLTAAFNPAGATSGSTIQTTDAGDLTAWNVAGDSHCTYDNTHSLFGKALAMKVAVVNTNGAIAWTTAYGATPSTYGRCYLYCSVLPGANPTSVIYNNVANAFVLGISSDGKFHIAVPANPLSNGYKTNSTTTISTGQWYRFEWNWSSSGASLACYASPDSITATETITSGFAFAAGTSAGLYVGTIDPSGGHTTTYWVAQVVEKGTAAIGPYPVSTTAPTVSGSTPVGSVLTTGNGTWNNGGTFTYAYQWTRDGVNIGGATASTYTTIAGDVGHAIGCTVTATGQQATNESASQASSNTIIPTAVSTGGANTGVWIPGVRGRLWAS